MEVIVVGGGLAGLSAAHTVLERGGRVAIIDKNSFLGGNSTKATSGLNGTYTRTQALAKIEDSPELFYKDTANSARDKIRPDLVRVLTYESGDAVEWLQERFSLDLSKVSRLGGHSAPRTHRGKEKFPGMTITYGLMEAFEDACKHTPERARLILKARVVGLTVENGRVTGVEYEKDGQRVQAAGVVIITTGGYAHDFGEGSLLQKYRPDLINLSTTNGDHCTGDGIKVAASIGASCVDMEYVQVHPTGLVDPREPDAKVKFLAAEALRGVGGLILDVEGNRFCDELGHRDYVTGQMWQRNKGPYRLILNSAAAKEIEWHCKHYMGRGLMKHFRNGAELAAEMNVPLTALQTTFNDYNNAATTKQDRFGRKYFDNANFSVEDAFWVAIITPVLHYCMGGLEIDANSQVKSIDGVLIDGLWAAGEVCGGVHGANRLGGNSLLDCVVFGRVAGRSAARHILSEALRASERSQLSNATRRIQTISKQIGGTNINISSDRGKVSFEITIAEPQGAKTVALPASTAVVAPAAKPVDSTIKRIKPVYTPAKPAKEESALSGGTGHILVEERAKATFNVESLTSAVYGGPEKLKRRRFIMSPNEGVDASGKYYMSRAEYMKEHIRHFTQIHKKFARFKITRDDVGWMTDATLMTGTLMNHYGLFLPTIETQGTDEQASWWVHKGRKMELVGSYAQTELGHGSNVRGLATIAEYDKNTQEFIINTPTLQSIKWWPGTLGKVATHAVIYAQLMLENKEYGVHAFVVQLRDEDHLPLPGIELGDLGTKLGDNGNDTGFCRLTNVRIPREFMLARFQHVTPEGVYVKTEAGKKSEKLHYATMMFTRAQMTATAAGVLSKAATIAVRYSAVRKQGFKNTGKGVSYRSEERQILDYQVQRYRLLKQVARAYAMKFSSQWLLAMFANMEETLKSPNAKLTNLTEMAATSAGMKAFCTYLAWEGTEDCRKCCGGNGYLLTSGVAQSSADYVWQTTAEGDWIILILQTAKFLVKSLQNVMSGKTLSGTVEYLDALRDKSVEQLAPAQAQSPAEFKDLNYLQKLFTYCAVVSVVNVGQEVSQQLAARNGNLDEAFNECALELFTTVRAHSFVVMLKAFVETINSVTDMPVRNVLTKVCALFACSSILDDPQWAGMLSMGQIRYVREATTVLLDELRPNAVTLVDAFDFPDNVLNSAIGRYDGNIYESVYDFAVRAPLNQMDPFEGYEEVLRPHLDRAFLSLRNRKISTPAKL
eukprot:GILK01005925.1.p1 GENE.GILK01005925.1~~GILK01005925.1.p1  ORF type:complete len:1245 (-),score=193.11 GILK01005925.1:130-3834(-)